MLGLRNSGIHKIEYAPTHSRLKREQKEPRCATQDLSIISHIALKLTQNDWNLLEPGSPAVTHVACVEAYGRLE